MHSSTGWKRHSDTEENVESGKSGRVTSVTIGKMPGRQVIVYDKRAEIIANRKLAWWEIWNAGRQRDGLGPPIRDNPRTHAVWRVEIRAGKDDLKGRWKITSWSDLNNKFGDLVALTLGKIRHTSPNGDGNRSRWPQSPLWLAVHEEVNQSLLEMRSYVSPQKLKVVQRGAHVQMLLGQITGLQIAVAAIERIPSAALPAYAASGGEQLAARIQSDPEHFARKLAVAAARYHVIDQ
jgi:hypothetical protein